MLLAEICFHFFFIISPLQTHFIPFPHFLVKSSDDTALLTLLHSSQSDHSCALPAFIHWYEDNYLDMNVSKTKELILDFRKNRLEPRASTTQGQEVQTVELYEYLGTIFDSQLKLYSGRRYYASLKKTNRYCNSFFPSAITLLNRIVPLRDK